MKKTFIITTAIALCIATSGFANEPADKNMTQSMVDKHMKEADTNGDGMISMEEQQACAKKMFEKADVNKDNMISKSEMIDAMDKEMSGVAKPSSK